MMQHCSMQVPRWNEAVAVISVMSVTEFRADTDNGRLGSVMPACLHSSEHFNKLREGSRQSVGRVVGIKFWYKALYVYVYRRKPSWWWNSQWNLHSTVQAITWQSFHSILEYNRRTASPGNEIIASDGSCFRDSTNHTTIVLLHSWLGLAWLGIGFRGKVIFNHMIQRLFYRHDGFIQRSSHKFYAFDAAYTYTPRSQLFEEIYRMKESQRSVGQQMLLEMIICLSQGSWRGRQLSPLAHSLHCWERYQGLMVLYVLSTSAKLSRTVPARVP